MYINETRKVQKAGNSLIAVIPKIITRILKVKKGDNVIFKNENERVYIEKEGNDYYS